jgi:hypothetical protein
MFFACHCISQFCIFGSGDTIIPYQTAELFTEKMSEEGNCCELVGYEGVDHGFFIQQLLAEKGNENESEFG